MDLKEALDCLEQLNKDMSNNRGYIILDKLSAFIYSDLDDVVEAIDEAIRTIDELESERDDLQKQLDELEG